VSVTAAAGFVAAGAACGIKGQGAPDLALVATADARPADAAAVFTTNRATAAPVEITRAHLVATGGRAAAVVLNSGNANAATGEAGLRHAERMCQAVAGQLGCRDEEVLVCSTGLIGIPLPIPLIEAGIPGVTTALAGGAEAGLAAAHAIMTTDTHPKESQARAGAATVGGMAKGAAMLAPRMATMLAVVTTDAAVGPRQLRRQLEHAVARSFNALSVDGCTSTNDTVIVLASGRHTVDEGEFGEALFEVCADLAGQMAGDAEGATKVIRVQVTGAASTEEAVRGARAVAESQLVKCSWYGCDPYWGRIVSELGSAGIAFDPALVRVAYGGIAVCRQGVAADHDALALEKVMAERSLEVTADLGLGDGEGTILTNDLTHGYIDENMRTS
jgi:glutamate N-acetyltransferase / amino-acid N-acetyltransferase